MEEFDQHDQGGDDDKGASQANHMLIRSYECNFCKRGFSNAQALGGHMNIHRKDKAKLRQQTQPSNLEAGKSCHEDPSKQKSFINLNIESQQQQADISKDVIRQLPLFAESPIISSSTEGQKPQAQIHRENSITMEEASLSSEVDLDLDLELRLGPEPLQDSSAATHGTRKFF